MQKSIQRADEKKIFISYRRADSSGMAGRLYDRLNTIFPETIFLDVDAIPLGANFLDEIEEHLDSCSLLLVLIGRHWFSCADGSTQIGDEDDYVTREIERALEKKISVIPVLLDGVAFPKEDLLPRKFAKGFLKKNALDLRHASFERDVAFLTKSVYSSLGIQPPTSLEQLAEDIAHKCGYSGFRYDEKARAWHAVIALFLGSFAIVTTLFSLLGPGSANLEDLFLTGCSAFPGIIGLNSTSKKALAQAGLIMSISSFMIQFMLFEFSGLQGR